MADTIAAIATAPAVGAIAILRLSGENALPVAAAVFKSKQNLAENPRMMCYGNFVGRDGTVIDNGLAVYMKAPGSYTGEDTVELFCHGSLVVQRELLECMYRAGARAAEPGEFTRRAFLNGKLELSQAEAVIDLIDAETLECAKCAAAQMAGHIGKKITMVRDLLLDITAQFYAYVDYPDEEIEEPEINKMSAQLREATGTLNQMIASFNQGRIIKDGARCALIGRPNVGKSSVLNALLGFERSIVSNIPGTTRDTIEEKARIGNVVLNLIDTAGLRDSDDTIEKIGIERAEQAVREAELILAVFDGAEELTAEDEAVLSLAKGRRAIALVNKNDLGICIDTEKIREVFGDNVCIISARESDGFDDFRLKINQIFADIPLAANGETITNARHAKALRDACEKVESAISALTAGFTPDIAIADLEGAIDALGEITGQTASEQILGKIFERFCVGK